MIRDIIKEPIDQPDQMRPFGTALQLKEYYVKGVGDDQLKENSGN